MGQHKSAKGREGKCNVSTGFGRAWVSIWESAPSCPPMVSLWRSVSVYLDLPLVEVPVCLVVFGKWLEWNFPQCGIPLFPRPFALEGQVVVQWSRWWCSGLVLLLEYPIGLVCVVCRALPMYPLSLLK